MLTSVQDVLSQRYSALKPLLLSTDFSGLGTAELVFELLAENTPCALWPEKLEVKNQQGSDADDTC